MTRTDLYRYYDNDGSLLYVGVSLGAIARLQQHRCKAEWFDEVAKVTIEKFGARAEAFAAEAQAIREERPVHNVQSSPFIEWPSEQALDDALFIWSAIAVGALASNYTDKLFELRNSNRK
jgi:predicted GIY-YIG superfamily endonuclease